MIGTQCMVCTEPNKFRTEVFQAQNIQYYIGSRVTEYEDMDISHLDEDRGILRAGISSFNTMCGYCHEINDMELRNQEEEIIELLLKVKAILMNEQIDLDEKLSLKYDVHDSIRGHYPIWANYIYEMEIKGE